MPPPVSVTDVLKPACPFCGSSTSHVYRSYGTSLGEEQYRRRRRCEDCRQTWPTLEGIDLVRFKRELVSKGVDPSTLDL